MFREVCFTIPGNPVGKGRPRFSRASGATYTPQKTKEYEDLVCVSYRNAEKNFMFLEKEPLCVKIDVFHAIPKNTNKKDKEGMISGELKPIKKPDVDNIAKIILDALNGVAYKDDSQVVSLCIEKCYSKSHDGSVDVYICPKL